ncbi:hypothetical protein [Streptomyces sp. NPDC058045]|uniref:hypothetical protein n=1 Tax=Streptomyces sp. NPDC058045 TaxID=3346311 RepID=UPI0036E71593
MARYGSTGYRPAGAERGERSAGVFAFIRAWAVGILVLLITEYIQMNALYGPVTGDKGPESFGSALLLVHLPNLVCVTLATWAAATVHPEPQSERPLQHAVAACAVPVAAQFLSLSVLWGRPGFDALGLWLSNGVLLAGCALGWTADKLRRDRSED